MKNLLYLIMAVFAFSSCDHDVVNMIDSEKGTGVPNFNYGEETKIPFESYDSFNIDFNLNIVSRDGVRSAIVYVQLNDEKAVEYAKINSLNTEFTFTAKNLKEKLGDKVSASKVKIGDRITFSLPYIILTSGDTITRTNKVTIQTTDEDGKIVLVDKEFDNLSVKIQNLIIFNNTLSYVIAGKANNIFSGDYTVVSTGLNEGAKSGFTQDAKITAKDGVFTVENLFGGLMKKWYNISAPTVTLNDFGKLATYNASSNGTYNKYFKDGIFKIDFNSTTQVITLTWEKPSWEISAVLVFTPKK